MSRKACGRCLVEMYADVDKSLVVANPMGCCKESDKLCLWKSVGRSICRAKSIW